MKLLGYGPNLQSIPLADRLEELSLTKRFQKSVLNGIESNPARTKAVIVHCPISTKITPSVGHNYTPYPKYTRVQTLFQEGAA